MPDAPQLHETNDVDEYAARVIAFLELEPVTRNVLLTVIGQVRSAWPAWTGPPSFWWVTRAGEVAGAASWTPSFPLLVSTMPAESTAQVAQSALARAAHVGVPLSGVTGPRETAALIASALARQTGRAVVERLRMVVHDLPEIHDVPRPPGGTRLANADDASLIASWLQAFNQEAHAGFGANIEGTTHAAIDAQRVWLWIHDGAPRSTTTLQRAAGGVARIGAVYTPPGERGLGYARRLVYEVSAAALGMPGIHTCTLNTDASNPVSNAIYRQIGYVPVAEHAEFALAG